jgi:hypothetical protein
MKKFCVMSAVVALLVMGSVAQSATIDWKGVTWDLNNATAVENIDGSLTLTSLITSSAGVTLHANRLSDTFASVIDPWVKWSYTGHVGDIFIEKEGHVSGVADQPRLGAGSPWGYQIASTRYTSSTGTTEENNFLLAADATPDSNDIYLGKRLDGTVDARFNSDSWFSGTQLKDNVGGNWGFQDVYLRMRYATIGATITFNDFQSGNGHTNPAAVPEASTLVGFGSALAMAGPGMIGWLKRRRS